MKLSIIIVSWNVKDDLLCCLQSIKENSASESFEIIVVDNGSSDGTVDAIKENFPGVIVIANSENRSFSAANNQAIKIAKGQYLFLLNPDTIIHPQSLDNLIKVLDEKPTAGACGPRFIDTDGKTHSSVGYLPTFRSLLYGKTFFRSLGIFRSHYKKLTANKFNYDRQSEVEQLSGAALMVNRSVINEIGLMDENFFLYYEDVDLCLRIRKAGWKIVYVPDAVITHIGGKSTEQVSAKKKLFLYSSALLYFRKHRGKFPVFLFSLLFKSGVIIKEIIVISAASLSCVFFIISGNREKLTDSINKIKNSAVFLEKYSWKFIFLA
jgi:GT2 family glycosyltransferase